MSIISDIKRMPKWIQGTFLVAVLIILILLFYPSQKAFVSLVPVKVPGSQTSLYAAQLEHMDDYGEVPTFAMFYAPWCGYCKKAMPHWDRLSAEIVDIKIIKINCDEEPELAKQHGIQSYPTIKFFPNGLSNPDKGYEYNGNRTYGDLSAFISKLMGNGNERSWDYQ